MREVVLAAQRLVRRVELLVLDIGSLGGRDAEGRNRNAVIRLLVGVAVGEELGG
jgi:hypothetical protein